MQQKSASIITIMANSMELERYRIRAGDEALKKGVREGWAAACWTFLTAVLFVQKTPLKCSSLPCAACLVLLVELFRQLCRDLSQGKVTLASSFLGSCQKQVLLLEHVMGKAHPWLEQTFYDSVLKCLCLVLN